MTLVLGPLVTALWSCMVPGSFSFPLYAHVWQSVSKSINPSLLFLFSPISRRLPVILAKYVRETITHMNQAASFMRVYECSICSP